MNNQQHDVWFLYSMGDTPVRCLKCLQWKEGDSYFYKKAGVIVWGISRDNAIQTSLFDTVDREKQAALAKAIDAINRKNGHNKIRVAVQGDEKGWQLKKEYISKQYTTNLDDVIVLKVK